MLLQILGNAINLNIVNKTEIKIISRRTIFQIKLIFFDSLALYCSFHLNIE